MAWMRRDCWPRPIAGCTKPSATTACLPSILFNRLIQLNCPRSFSDPGGAAALHLPGAHVIQHRAHRDAERLARSTGAAPSQALNAIGVQPDHRHVAFPAAIAPCAF